MSFFLLQYPFAKSKADVCFISSEEAPIFIVHFPASAIHELLSVWKDARSAAYFKMILK